jgi:hypothetical protein
LRVRRDHRSGGEGERRDGNRRRQDRGFHVAFSMFYSRRASGCAWRYEAGQARMRAGADFSRIRM